MEKLFTVRNLISLGMIIPKIVMKKQHVVYKEMWTFWSILYRCYSFYFEPNSIQNHHDEFEIDITFNMPKVTDWRTDRRTDLCTDRRTDWRTNRRTDRRTDRRPTLSYPKRK